MPLPFLLTSSDGFTGGGAYTRFGAPTLSGIWTPSTGGAASQVDRSTPGALALVQHGTAVSTGGARSQIVSTAGVGVASHVYIAQSSAAIMTSSGGGGTAPAYTGMGAAIMYDAGTNRIMVFSTVNGVWLATVVLTGLTT